MPPRKSARSGAAAPAQPAKGTRGAAATASAVAAPVARDDDVDEKEDEEMEEEDEEEHSAGEESSPSKNVRRSQRATRNAQDVPATSTKAERVTRSRARKSRNESPEPSPPAEDEDDDSEPVVPKKRGAKRGPKGSPAKKRGRRPSGRRVSTASSKKKGRGGRRPRKRDSDDEEESEESELDLGDSEEEEREEDADDDDDYEGEKPKSKALPPATPGSRRSSRHAAPGSRVASVVLERMEGSTTSSRPTRGGRGARTSQKKKQEDVAESGGDEVEEEEEDEKPAKRKPRTAAASKQQPPRRGRGRSVQGRSRLAKAEAEEEDDEEEDEQEVDDAPEATEGSATTERDKNKNKSKNKGKDKKKEKKKESKAAVKSDKNEDEEDGDKDDDDIPTDKGEGDDEEDDDDSKMDVDTADDKEEAKGGKRKLDLTEANLLPAKKTKTLDGDSNEVSGSSSKSAADEPSDGTAKKGEGEKSGAETGGVKVVNGAESASKPSEARPTDAEPKVNGEGEGDAEDASDVVSASIGAKVLRRVVSSASPKTATETAASFSLVSYNLGSGEWATRHESLLEEVTALAPSILCLQGVDDGYFKNSLDSALKSDGYLGLYKAGKKAADQEAESAGARKQDAAVSTRGLATFYLLSHFELVHHAEFETRELLTKVVETSSLSDVDKETAKGLLARIVAPVIVTKLRAVPSGKCVTVANVELSPHSSSRCGAEDLDDSVLALQAAAVLREVLDLSDVSTGESHVVCGALGRLERGSIIRQLLERGRVDVDTLESLKTKAGGEQKNLSLVSLLENSFRHALPNLRSSYESVLGHELKCPDDKSPKDTVWISADSLHTKSVLDFAFPPTTADVHISLKADLSFVH